MHKALITTAVFCIFTVRAFGQTPNQDKIDALLNSMEKRASSIDSMQATCKRIDVHPLTKKSTVVEGGISWRQPNLARIDLCPADEAKKKDENKSHFERFIADGKYLWEYNAKEKVIVAHEMPKDGATDNILLMLMHGIKAQELRKRFDVKWASDDEWFAVVRLIPKNAADRQDFTTLDLAIWIKNPNPQGKPDLTNLPAQIHLLAPNGREVVYRFGDMQPNARIDEGVFKARRITGFEVKWATAAPAKTP
jgi:TIGR03009 family protein